MTPDFLDHAASVWSPGIACLRMPYLLLGFQSLLPGAIFLRAKLNCSVHILIPVYGMDGHWKDLECAVNVSTCM